MNNTDGIFGKKNLRIGSVRRFCQPFYKMRFHSKVRKMSKNTSKVTGCNHSAGIECIYIIA
jgi:hypothetical protein